MKSHQIKLRLLLCILLLFIPLTAHADAIIPYMVVPWGQAFLLPLVILIEAITLRWLLRDRFRPILFQSFVANLVSTVLGAGLYLLTMPRVGDHLFEWSFKGNFSSEAVRNACISFLFAIVLWAISWFSETAVIARMRKASLKEISFPCAKANLISYALLLTLAVWFGKASTSVEAHVDTKRNSSNIETYLKPDKNYPYIGFWKSNCSEDFGLAIESTSDGKYTVAFCGPGGCDKTDSLQHTTLIDDPTYRIIDNNTIETRYSGSVTIYHRCGPNK